MFFLIRCVFWLTVVFTTIFSNQNPAAPHRQGEAAQQAQLVQTHDDSADKISQGVQNWVTAELEEIWNKATGSCSQAPADCAALAKRLSDFARLHAPVEPSYEKEAMALPVRDRTPQRAVTQASPATVQVPLPPLRPQHIRLSARPREAEAIRAQHFSAGRVEKRSGRS